MTRGLTQALLTNEKQTYIAAELGAVHWVRAMPRDTGWRQWQTVIIDQ